MKVAFQVSTKNLDSPCHQLSIIQWIMSTYEHSWTCRKTTGTIPSRMARRRKNMKETKRKIWWKSKKISFRRAAMQWQKHARMRTLMFFMNVAHTVSTLVCVMYVCNVLYIIYIQTFNRVCRWTRNSFSSSFLFSFSLPTPLSRVPAVFTSLSFTPLLPSIAIYN